MHPLGLFPAKKKDDPMWCNRVSHVKDVWVMYPDLVVRVTVQCMSALYHLQALQSATLWHILLTSNHQAHPRQPGGLRGQLVLRAGGEGSTGGEAELAHHHPGAAGGDPREHH
jgi:hypothetical protein